MFVIVIIPLLLAAAVLYMMKPSVDTLRKKGFQSFERTYIAHKGLHNDAIPENSIGAIRRAISCGFGVEVDVMLTGDKQPIVIHDDNLSRLCGANVSVSHTAYDELKGYTLRGTNEHIPLFKQVLEEVGGRVPLIVEIKAEYVYEDLCNAVLAALEGYEGPVCIQSFSPYVVEWFKNHAPDMLRGQLSMNYFDPRHKRQESFPLKLALTLMLYNFKAQPDFISYDFVAYNSPVMYIMRNIFGVETVGWTMTSQKCIDDLVGKSFDIAIFEGFIPREREDNLY